MTVNRQKFSSIVGLVIVAFHIALTGHLWFVFGPEADSAVAAAEIATPLTVTYAISVVAWFVATNGLITSNQQVGIALVILTVMVVGSFLGALLVGPYLYLDNRLPPKGSINTMRSWKRALAGCSCCFSIPCSARRMSRRTPPGESRRSAKAAEGCASC